MVLALVRDGTWLGNPRMRGNYLHAPSQSGNHRFNCDRLLGRPGLQSTQNKLWLLPVHFHVVHQVNVLLRPVCLLEGHRKWRLPSASRKTCTTNSNMLSVVITTPACRITCQASRLNEQKPPCCPRPTPPAKIGLIFPDRYQSFPESKSDSCDSDFMLKINMANVTEFGMRPHGSVCAGENPDLQITSPFCMIVEGVLPALNPLAKLSKILPE